MKRMFRRPTKEINAEFMAEERFLDSLQRVVRESCITGGLSQKDTTSVLLAIEEGATNIIRHAYLYEKGTIRLRIVIYSKLIVFSLIDSGRSFNPEGSDALDLEKLVESGRKGGLGFYMIKRIMDTVEYISAAGFNELRMTKRIAKTSAQSRPLLRRLFTLRVKFSFWTFLLVLAITGGGFYYFDRHTSRQIYDHLDDTVKSLAMTVADQAAGYLINRRSAVEFDQLIVSYLRANPEIRLIVLTDSVGLIMAHSEDVRSIRKPYRLPDAINEARMETPQPYNFAGENLSYLMTPIMTGERQIGTVHLVYSAEVLHAQLDQARQQIASLTLVLLLLGVLAIYLLSNYFVRPIANITHRVRRFTSGDLEAELPLEGAEEFFEISKAFNQMMTRLSRDRQNIIAREKLAKEIEVASQIQKTLLPTKLPDLPGLEIDAFYRAASMVSGDLYDVFEIAPGRYCLTVADVSGKGVPASMLMSMLRTVIQIFAVEEQSAKKTLVRVNLYLQDNMPPGMFITVMLVIYDVSGQKLSLVSAGHNPMLYFKAQTGEVMKVNPSGMPLGMPSTLMQTFEERLDEVHLSLYDGDIFFIFTDGLSETINKQGECYGIDRLFKFIGHQVDSEPSQEVSEISSAITRELDRYAGFAKPNDDISFIIARDKRGDDDDNVGETRQQTDMQVVKLTDPDRKQADSQ